MHLGNTALSYGLIAGGLGLLGALLAVLSLTDWAMPFPWTLVLVALISLPAAGLSMLYSAAARHHLKEDSVDE